MPLRMKFAPEAKLHLCTAFRYRIPRSVTSLHIVNGRAYPVCPRCMGSLERKYTAFCQYCGQRLSWDRFSLGPIPFQQKAPDFD